MKHLPLSLRGGALGSFLGLPSQDLLVHKEGFQMGVVFARVLWRTEPIRCI